MNKFIIPAPPWTTNLAVNSVATCDLPIGPRYHVAWNRLQFTTGTGTLTTALSNFIGLIRVKVNGRVQRSLTATQLNAYNSLMGQEYHAYVTTNAAPNVIVAAYDSTGALMTVTNGQITSTPYSLSASTSYVLHLPIFFSEPFRKQYFSADLPAWPTAWPGGKSAVATFQLELTYGPSTNATTAGTFNSISTDVEIDYQLGDLDKAGNPVFLISKMNVFQLTGMSTANTDYILTTLPRKDVYQSLHCWSDHATDKISRVKVKVENNLIRDTDKVRLDCVDLSRGINPFSIVAGRTDVFFDYDDQPSTGLPMFAPDGRMVQDFQLILQRDVATATTSSILAVTYGPLD